MYYLFDYRFCYGGVMAERVKWKNENCRGYYRMWNAMLFRENKKGKKWSWFRRVLYSNLGEFFGGDWVGYGKRITYSELDVTFQNGKSWKVNIWNTPQETDILKL